MVSESLRFCVESLYLATGGADLIGSHIVDELVRRGECVRVLDDFSTGHIENLAEARPHIERIEGDIRDPATVRAATEGVEYVLHQAALPSAQRSTAEQYSHPSR